MSKTKVAISGTGQIGVTLLRQLMDANYAGNLEVVAINDVVPVEQILASFLLNSTYGKWNGTAVLSDGNLVINGRTVKVLKVGKPAELPWKDLGIDIVFEASGVFRNKEGAKGGYGDHIKAGAKKVILTVPAKDGGIDLTLVRGVNDNLLTAEMVYLSNASCTTNCAAPALKVLIALGLVKVNLTTIHAPTNDQAVRDKNHSDARRGRQTNSNIIYTSTGAAGALQKIFPDLEGKIMGQAIRVDSEGSTVKLVLTMEKELSVEEINAAFKKAADGDELKGVLKYTELPYTSKDVIGDSESCVFDSKLTRVDGTTVEVVLWYDNVLAYCVRAIEVAGKVAELMAA
jgi:glyceraldehyde 3-phosphate dehydrogenase